MPCRKLHTKTVFSLEMIVEVLTDVNYAACNAI